MVTHYLPRTIWRNYQHPLPSHHQRRCWRELALQIDIFSIGARKVFTHILAVIINSTTDYNLPVDCLDYRHKKSLPIAVIIFKNRPYKNVKNWHIWFARWFCNFNLDTRWAQDMPNMYPRYAQYMPELCLSYAQDMPQIYLRYAHDMPKICPTWIQEMLAHLKRGQ